MWRARGEIQHRIAIVAAIAALGIGGMAPVDAAPARRARRPAPDPVLTNAVRLRIEPGSATLTGPRAEQRLIVTAVLRDGVEVDVTARATWSTTAPKVLRVGKGIVRPAGNGSGKVIARFGRLSAGARVTVEAADEPPTVSFMNDVVPVLSRAGCNQSNCHGSPVGKAGFKLSLFGYEPDLDYAAIVKEGDGRRIDLQRPEESLLLQKPLARVPHGGGQRFKVGSAEYRLLVEWIRAGAPGIGELEARVRRLRVFPEERWLMGPRTQQRLVVIAEMSDGTLQDVTQRALYSANDDSIVAVDDRGVATAVAPGETAVMIRHLGQVAVARLGVLPPWKIARYPEIPRHNFIDELVFAKLRKMRVIPSDLSSDEEFLRRVYLDVCGIIPTPEEARSFLADPDPNKRQRLIDSLLERPDFVDLWTLKWNDLLRNNPRLTRTGVLPFYQWIREKIAANTPYDQFVRELLTATGRNGEEPPLRADQPARRPALTANLPINGAVNYFMVSRDPLDLTSATSQIFLGVRIECARCHNHPFEKWTQTDYYGLAQFFGGLRIIPANNQTSGAVLPPTVLPAVRRLPRALNQPSLLHPKTNQPVEPKFLDETPVTLAPGADRRAVLAEWITSKENPYFARAIVNRIWAHYFGRGIVEPVDDFRATNPPVNPELLDALAQELVKQNFDLKAIHRLILNSRVYQLSSRPNRYNRQETSNFSRAYPRRLMAEQLYDSICQATGVFNPAAALGRRQAGAAAQIQRGLAQLGPIERTVQIPTPRAPGSVGLFLDTFGRPRREVVCECERSSDGNLAQALLLMNGDDVNRRIGAPFGRVARLARSPATDDEVIEELFLATVTRRPKAEEARAAKELLAAAASRQEGLEDLAWSLINSREFLFNH